MTSPKSVAMPAYRIDDKFRRHIARCLNFLAPIEGATYADLDALTNLDRFIWAMLQTTDDPFQIRVVKRTWREPVIDTPGPPYTVPVIGFPKTASPNVSNPAARKLADQIQQFSNRSAFPSPTHSAVNQLLFAPHIRLLLDLFDRHPIRDYIGRGLDLNRIVSQGRIRAEIYNDFVARFRQEMRARNLMRRELHNWNLGSDENVPNLNSYLDGLFAKHGTLTVQHFSLFHAWTRSNLVLATVEGQHNDLRGLRACRAKFFDCMRRKPALFTEDPGYVWSILPTLDGGYALHLTLLFSTVALHKVLDDKRVEATQARTALQDHADQVGVYWVERATGGLGCYQRGDKIVGFYGPDWVDGEVRADDLAGRQRLTETLGYLARRRALVRLKNEPKGPYFGMPNRQS
ncbi:hypothetical protein [Burkholderia sp. MBR-1]|uniref:hypothetical protein n=1 Tax=Burkholderia sp. MBR-1 TaxID=2732364 RepID=UPI0015EF67ED|nr:hypothetical protein [Burkholderia sp. MBR-1]QMI43984.1 hypothetical protein MBR110_00330 [Burkholderia sp. MBR-1]